VRDEEEGKRETWAKAWEAISGMFPFATEEHSFCPLPIAMHKYQLKTHSGPSLGFVFVEARLRAFKTKQKKK